MWIIPSSGWFISSIRKIDADTASAPTSSATATVALRGASMPNPTNIAASHAINTTNIGVGINNLTNRLPAVIYSGFAGTSDSSTYDYMGRFVYMRLAQLF